MSAIHPQTLKAGLCALFTCEVLSLEARPLNLALDAVELLLLVIGSSRVATRRSGKSSVVWSGIAKNMSGWEVIWLVTPAVNSFIWRRRYSKKASLFHRPSSIIVDVRTLERYSSIAALVLNDLVPTFLLLTPNLDSPI